MSETLNGFNPIYLAAEVDLAELQKVLDLQPGHLTVLGGPQGPNTFTVEIR